MPSHINVSDFSLTKVCRNTSLSKEKSLNESSQRKATHNAQHKDKLSALTYIYAHAYVYVYVYLSQHFGQKHPYLRCPEVIPRFLT